MKKVWKWRWFISIILITIAILGFIFLTYNSYIFFISLFVGAIISTIYNIIIEPYIKEIEQSKYIQTSIYSNILIGGIDNKIFLGVRAINKTVRPITITAYGIAVPNEKMNVIISPTHPEHILINSKLPCEIKDGQSCGAYISKAGFKETMDENGWKFPLKVKAYFNTNDGVFMSKAITIKT